MATAFKATCVCGKEVQWIGEVADRPACEACGLVPEPAGQVADRLAVEELLTDAVAREWYEWERRSPAQEAAYHAGCSAAKENPDPMRHFKGNPHKGGPLAEWWSRGFNSVLATRNGS